VARFPRTKRHRPYRIGKPDVRRPKGSGRYPDNAKQVWWPFGSTRIERVRDGKAGENAVVAYVLKYVGKDVGKAPLILSARHYGIGGLDAGQRQRRTWDFAPKRVQAESDGGKVRRLAEGGWQVESGQGSEHPAGWRDVAGEYIAFPQKGGVSFSGPYSMPSGASFLPAFKHRQRLHELFAVAMRWESITMGIAEPCEAVEDTRKPWGRFVSCDVGGVVGGSVWCNYDRPVAEAREGARQAHLRHLHQMRVIAAFRAFLGNPCLACKMLVIGPALGWACAEAATAAKRARVGSSSAPIGARPEAQLRGSIACDAAPDGWQTESSGGLPPDSGEAAA